MIASPKRILIFIDWFTPGYKAGGPISSNANLLDHLSPEFDFYVLTRDTDYLETQPYTNVVSNHWNTLPNGAKVYYISRKQLSIINLIKISKIVPFDTVFVNGIYSLYFSLFPVIWFGRIKRKKVIVSARGMLSDHTFSAKKFKKKVFYFAARLFGLYNGVTIHATNANEELQIRRNVGFRETVRIAANLPPCNKSNIYTSLSKGSGELRLVSIARISPEKNTLFALDVLEKLANKRISTSEEANYHITFDLYGSVYQKDYFAQCEDVVKRLPLQIKVNFRGSIQKDLIASTLKAYHFMFMPSQGENYGHSVVESFLAGRPVIISDRTPWKNLRKITNYKLQITETDSSSSDYEYIKSTNNHITYEVGWDVALEQPEQFVEVIEKCILLQQNEFDTISLNAYRYGQQISSDNQVLEANRNLFS